LKIQEREAKLTGMEAPQKQDTHITIDIPWLTRDRLSYKDAQGEVVENVTDITPILEVRKAADLVQVEQRAERLDLNPWKPAPPEQGLGHILRDHDRPK
jgi:hypothetical protein